MGERLGVGFLGAGQATQAIHLPVLGSMADRFEVRHVVDVDIDVATRVADPHGAYVSTDAVALLDDSTVEVVVICSPNALHAEQVIASCKAGKRAVLCEKPLAVSEYELDAVRAALADSGSALFVGAMHAYDPAGRAALVAWASFGIDATFVCSTILLPSNAVFVSQATQLVEPAIPPRPPLPAPDAERLRNAVLGLAVHDIPLVRVLAPEVGAVGAADVIAPFGYSIVHGSADATVEWHAMMGGTWPPKWTLRAVGPAREVRIEFPPSYVLGGSARAEIIDASKGVGTTTVFEFPTNGYQAQWEDLFSVVQRGTEPLVPLATAVSDARWTLALANRVADFASAEGVAS